MKISRIVSYLDNRFPKDLAWEQDLERIGLVIGDANIDVKNVLLTLDLTLDVLEEAISKDANLIICHHPLIFNPVFKIFFQSQLGKILSLMFKHQISLYVMHTNLDIGVGGVNDVLAKRLGITNVQGVVEKDSYLRYGEIKAVSLLELAEIVKKEFNLRGVRMVGDENKKITTVGIIGGAGGREDEILNALNHQLDCYITGEIRLSAAQLAQENNLALIEINHGVEKYVFDNLTVDLEKDLGLKNQVFITSIETDPLIFV